MEAEQARWHRRIVLTDPVLVVEHRDGSFCFKRPVPQTRRSGPFVYRSQPSPTKGAYTMKHSKMISRRSFLQAAVYSTAALSALALTGCGASSSGSSAAAGTAS